MTSQIFPKEASDAKLLIPEGYEPYNSNPTGKCYFKFDAERELLLLVSDESDDIIDIIDTRDVVGASIEIGLSDSSDNIQSLSSQRDDNEPPSDTLKDTQGAAVLEIYVYPRRDPSESTIFSSCGFESSKSRPNIDYVRPADISNFGPRYAKHRRFQVAPAEDLGAASLLAKAIRKISRPENTKEDRLLVIVNPYSGTKKGEMVFSTIVAPLFEQAGIEYDVLITQHANHAFERMEEQESDSSITDVSKYDGIVAIGGDGIIHETLQGIQKRSDCNQILSKLKLGTVGSGTSNGLAKSIAHSSQEQAFPLEYAFLIAKGRSAKMDLSKYQTRSSSYLSFLTFSWAMIADIDIESELIRFLGFLRMDVWGFWRVLNLRKYRAKFSYLKPSQGTQTSECPPLDQPIPNSSEWVSCEDDFILFWASQVTHAAENMFQSPGSKLDDGLFQIFIIR